jgi:hypothetical protein
MSQIFRIFRVVVGGSLDIRGKKTCKIIVKRLGYVKYISYIYYVNKDNQ